MKRLDFNCQIVSTKLTSYDGTSSTGKVKQAMGLTADLTGRRVIIVEDIVDTGNTLSAMVAQLKKLGANVRVAALLDKPSRRKVDFHADYIGREIPNAFVVGFGLDYAEKYRNLPYVGILRREVYESSKD
jgi:hypoxanthine phosphoribosyltransferase